MSDRVVFDISPGGKTTFLYQEPWLASLEGRRTKTRVSHVEPVNLLARLLFRAIRKLFGNHGRWAAWTRTWSVRWRARIIGGPTLGPFDNRRDAIQSEIEWLQREQLG